jgi:multiple sugar transport system ATP-binding protein
VSLGIRPEYLRVTSPGGGTLDATVDVLEYLGADTPLIVDAGPAGRLTVLSGGPTDLRPGDLVALAPWQPCMRLFDSDGQALRQDAGGVPEGEPA